MIQLKDIYKSFGEQKVLDGVNLEIPEKKITVIIGQSGQGKSVLLKMLIGLMEPDEGFVLVDGVNPRSLDLQEKVEFTKRFGMLFQNAALFDSMNVVQNVAFPLIEHTSFKEDEIADRVAKILNDVGLPNILHKMPSELSGGMRKRVGLARALVLEPKIILYDEPTTGLDPILADSVDRLILETQERLGITTVVVSHDLQAVFKIADKVAMLHQGKIWEEGDPKQFQASKKPFVQEFILGKAAASFIG